MDMKALLTRAARVLRQDLRLYLVAISSLCVAFLCLGGALLALANLDAVAARWGESARITVYLRDKANTADVDRLRLALMELSDVREVDHLSSEEARKHFLGAEHDAVLTDLPKDIFPASLEVNLQAGIGKARIDHIASLVKKSPAVDEVETYRGFLSHVDSVVGAAKSANMVLGFLVIVCVLAVVANTIRLAVAGRRAEIEIMKLCGATSRYIRGPFVAEGAIQGFAAATVAVFFLWIAYMCLHHRVDSAFAGLTGVSLVFLQPSAVFGLLVGGTLVGALGSAVSLRRYLVDV